MEHPIQIYVETCTDEEFEQAFKQLLSRCTDQQRESLLRILLEILEIDLPEAQENDWLEMARHMANLEAEHQM